MSSLINPETIEYDERLTKVYQVITRALSQADAAQKRREDKVRGKLLKKLEAERQKGEDEGFIEKPKTPEPVINFDKERKRVNIKARQEKKAEIEKLRKLAAEARIRLINGNVPLPEYFNRNLDNYNIIQKKAEDGLLHSSDEDKSSQGSSGIEGEDIGKFDPFSPSKDNPYIENVASFFKNGVLGRTKGEVHHDNMLITMQEEEDEARRVTEIKRSETERKNKEDSKADARRKRDELLAKQREMHKKGQKISSESEGESSDHEIDPETNPFGDADEENPYLDITRGEGGTDKNDMSMSMSGTKSKFDFGQIGNTSS